jgi:hypothetical protein
MGTLTVAAALSLPAGVASAQSADTVLFNAKILAGPTKLQAASWR